MNQFQKEFDPDTSSIVFYLIYEPQEYVTEVITQWGLCRTFNSAFSHDLLNFNITSKDFHYEEANIYKRLKRFKHAHPSDELPRKVSTSKAGLWVGFGNNEENEESLELIHNDFDGYLVIFHDPFELPSKNSKTVNFNKQLQTKVLIDKSH
ncbi:hypothetical protein ACKWTF_015227 [Chironomus riparius]